MKAVSSMFIISTRDTHVITLSLPILLTSLKCSDLLSVSKKPVMYWQSADCLCDCQWFMVLLLRAAVCFFVLLNVRMTWGESPKSPEFTGRLWLMFYWPTCCCFFSFREGPLAWANSIRTTNTCIFSSLMNVWQLKSELCDTCQCWASKQYPELTFFVWLKAGLWQNKRHHSFRESDV